MKIAVTAKGNNLDDGVDQRFGRCPYFLIVDTESMAFEAVENPNMELGGGAGIQSAQLLAERDVQAVLTGNCGPNAHQTLSAAEIQVFSGVSGTITEAIDLFASGRLSSIREPNVASHFGVMGESVQGGGMNQEGGTDMGRGTGQGRGAGQGRGQGRGMGQGRGLGQGQGMGQGRGMGQGQGMGQGRGMGKGQGMGRGMGQGQDMGLRGTPPREPVENHTADTVSPAGGELDALKTEARKFEAQLNSIHGRIEQLESEPSQHRLVAVVNSAVCTGCGLCERICPVDAITMEETARVDETLCTGCGLCIAECPLEALTFRKI